MSDWMILVAVALVITSVGFIKFIWFLSIGYGFAVAGLMAALAVLFYKDLTAWTVLLMAVTALYALRLGIFLTAREAAGGSYKQVLAEATSGVKKVPLFVSVAVWITVAFLFFAQVSPLYFRFKNGLAGFGEPFLIAGLIITVIGFFLQAVADTQKSAAKKKSPDRFCDTGLYRIVRCPNYLGEILIWTGMLTSSICCLRGVWQWVISILGYICIVFVMFNGARRLEKRQTENYGSSPEYQDYTARTPILIPLVPLYSLKNWKFLG